MWRRFALPVVTFIFALLVALSLPKGAQGLQGEFLRIWLETKQCFGEEAVIYPYNGLVDMAIRSQTLAVLRADIYVNGEPYQGSASLCIRRDETSECAANIGLALERPLDPGYSLFEYSVEISPTVSGYISFTMWMFLESGCPGGIGDPDCRWYSASTVPAVTEDYCTAPWTPSPTRTPTPTRRPSKTPTPTETVTAPTPTEEVTKTPTVTSTTTTQAETKTVTPTGTATSTTTPTATLIVTSTSTPDWKFRLWYFPLVWQDQ